MRRANSIAVFLLLVFSAILFSYQGFFIYVKSQKSAFRHEILSAGLFSTQSVTIRSDNVFKDVNGMEWKEDNRELVMSGVYYEVLGIEQQGARSIIHIVEDKKENKLFASFFAEKSKCDDLCLNLLKCISFQYDVPEPDEQTDLPVITFSYRQVSSRTEAGHVGEIYLPPAVLC